MSEINVLLRAIQHAIWQKSRVGQTAETPGSQYEGRLKRSKSTCLSLFQELKALNYLSDFHTNMKPETFRTKTKESLRILFCSPQ